MIPDIHKPLISQMTWYQSQNYGTVLQAYALQRTLNDIVADARLVNYDPAPWQQRNQSGLRKSKPFKAARMFQQRAMGVAPFTSAEKSAAFKGFTSTFIKETEPVASPDDFEALNSFFDAFVCGSDQVWSPRCFDPRYYLDFVADDKPRIAYAPSFGCDSLPDTIAATIAPLVSGFNALSARETAGARMVRDLSGRECKVVCDPVVLLGADEWRSISRHDTPLVSERYCLCYFLGRSEGNWKLARSIAKKKGLKLVIIPVFNGDIKRGGMVPSGVGPLEFLWLIDNASHVCTDSFHGLVFSTLLERDFSVFERFKPGSTASQNVRIESFLSLTDLEDRLIRWDAKDASCSVAQVNFASAETRISSLRQSSLEYLRGALKPVLSEH